jgi:hypothetical protein
VGNDLNQVIRQFARAHFNVFEKTPHINSTALS